MKALEEAQKTTVPADVELTEKQIATMESARLPGSRRISFFSLAGTAHDGVPSARPWFSQNDDDDNVIVTSGGYYYDTVSQLR